MFKNRLFISYVATALFYLLVAGIFFYLQQSVFVAKKEVKEQVLCMSLHTFVPEVMPVEKAELQKPVREPEEPIQEPETQEDPVLKEEPEVQKEVVPEPTVVTPKPKPILKQAKKKPVAKKNPPKPIIRKKAATSQPTKQQAASRQDKSSAAEQKQFLAAIREKINQHKSYPRIAKKRGMQGAVYVKFTILSSGKVAQISVSGPKIFHASAEHAVKSAFPIDAKKAPLSLPTTVSITLQYKFR